VVKATLPRLQEILEAQGLTNGDVARGTQIAHAQISRIFSGKQGMSLTSALRIAGFLGVTVERLASILKAGSNLGKRLKKKAGKEARRSGTGGYPK
jgi:transcriptional regulator with XRE-family HTH domain